MSSYNLKQVHVCILGNHFDWAVTQKLFSFEFCSLIQWPMYPMLRWTLEDKITKTWFSIIWIPRSNYSRWLCSTSHYLKQYFLKLSWSSWFHICPDNERDVRALYKEIWHSRCGVRPCQASYISVGPWPRLPLHEAV